MLKIDNRTITLNVSGQAIEFKVPDSIKVSRDGTESEVSTIRPSDKLTLTTGQNNEVLAVESTSSQRSGYKKLAIPAALIALLVLAGLVMISKNNNKAHIKTAPTSEE